MGRVKDFEIWHVNRYGHKPQDWSRLENYKRDRDWQDEKFEEVQKAVQASARNSSSATTYDLFISHASEDKDDFVEPLVESLVSRKIKVWYDKFEIELGMSLRRSIDKGLAESKFGLVILSPDFLDKK